MQIANETTISPEMPDRQSLPFRIGVGIALFDHRGRVWLGRRLPKWSGDRSFWQMPQGGLNGHELPFDAAIRELGEETGTRAFEPIAEIEHWLSYEVPDDLLGIALKGRYRGQRQRWFAMRFTGRDSDFDISGVGLAGGKAEFDAWRWSTLEDAVAGVVPWKLDLYRTVARAFGPLVSASSRPEIKASAERAEAAVF